MISVRRASIFWSGGALLGRLVRSRWIARVWRTLLFFFGLDFSFIPPVYPSRREVQIGLDKRTKTLTWDKWSKGYSDEHKTAEYQGHARSPTGGDDPAASYRRYPDGRVRALWLRAAPDADHRICRDAGRQD